MEFVGLGSSSSMECFASWRSWQQNGEGRKIIGDTTFKEKMNQEETHHHRKPWIRAWR